MKTCYIYFIFLRKKTFSETFWLIFNASFQICKMLFHWVVVNIQLLVFWKYVKKIFRRKPTISLKSNVIEYYSLIYWFFLFFCLYFLFFFFVFLFFVFLGILYAPYKFISKGSCWFLEDIILKVWVITGTRVFWCAQIQNFQRRKMVHSIKKTKPGLIQACL